MPRSLVLPSASFVSLFWATEGPKVLICFGKKETKRKTSLLSVKCVILAEFAVSDLPVASSAEVSGGLDVEICFFA